MAARVREFSLANPSEEPSYAIVLGRFEKLLDRAAEFAAQQRAGLIAVRAASASRAGLRHELQSKFLRHLVGVGMVAAKDRAEPDNQFQLPRGNASHLVFLTAVKGMLAKAEEQKEALVSQGMSVGLLEDLGKSVASFEAANQASIGGRRAHVGARAGLRTVAAELTDLVVLLDGLNRYRFGKDPKLMAEWESARNVVGPSVARSAPNAGDGVVPPTPGDVAPAA